MKTLFIFTLLVLTACGGNPDAPVTQRDLNWLWVIAIMLFFNLESK